MANIAYWYDEAGGSAWDRLQLGKHVMPGAWKVTCVCERDIDKKKSKGKDSARVKDRGYQPAEMTFVGQFVDEKDWVVMQKILPALHPRKKGGPRSQLHAQHPALAVMGVVDVYIKSIKAPIISDGILELSIDAIEYTPPKPTTKPKDPFHMTLDSPAAAFYRNQTFAYGSQVSTQRLSELLITQNQTSATAGSRVPYGQFSQEDGYRRDASGHVIPPAYQYVDPHPLKYSSTNMPAAPGDAHQDYENALPAGEAPPDLPPAPPGQVPDDPYFDRQQGNLGDDETDIMRTPTAEPVIPTMGPPEAQEDPFFHRECDIYTRAHFPEP